MADKELPKYLSELPPPTEEDQWSLLAETFSHLRDLVEHYRLETRAEALSQTPTWFDPELGVRVRPWLLIPYRRAYADTDQQQSFLRTHFEQARSLIPKLEEMFVQKQATVEFLSAWGAFRESISVVETVYFSEHDDLGPDRAGAAGGARVSTESQRKWVAHLLVRQIDADRHRQHAERDVAKAIHNFIGTGDLPPDFDKKWFEVILNKGLQLRSTYSQKHLSNEAARELAAQPVDDIPPTDIPIPKT